MLNKVSVDDINVKGQRVLVRCDFNVPLQDGKITDENRLVASLPTIKKLIADGGKVILCSHLGKPKGEPKPELSLAPVAVRLSELLGQEVKFAADPEVVGPNAKAAVEAGAPENTIGCITMPSMPATNELMHCKEVKMIIDYKMNSITTDPAY